MGSQLGKSNWGGAGASQADEMKMVDEWRPNLLTASRRWLKQTRLVSSRREEGRGVVDFRAGGRMTHHKDNLVRPGGEANFRWVG